MADGLLDLPEAAGLLGTAAAGGVDLRSALQADDVTLRATEIAQPALLFVECMLLRLLPPATQPMAAAGHSVGEYAAAVAAGALTAKDAMRVVIARGAAMASMREGAMCALLGIDDNVARSVCEDAELETGETVVVANINAPGQLVISGTRAGIDAATRLARERGARRAVPLNVSGAFHSPLMGPAAAAFADTLDGVEITDPRIPVVCNVDAAAIRDGVARREHLRAQLTAPVRWTECVQRLVALGAGTLVEVGPGTVLTGLARRIAPDVPAISVSTAESARHLGAAVVAG